MRTLIKAAVRIIIIFMFVAVFKIVINSAQWIIRGPGINIEQNIYYFIVTIGGQLVIYTLILCLLWWKTDWIVRIIAGNSDDNELVIKTANLDLLKVAMRIFGIFLIVTSIPDLFGLATYHMVLIPESDLIYTPVQKANGLMNLVTTIVTMAIGAWLVIGTRGITKVIDHVMNAPISKVEK